MVERNLVPTSLSSGEEKESLEDIRRKKFEQALWNFVTGTTPKDVVYSKPARGGVQVDYVPGWWFIEQLNSLFGHYWDLDVLEHHVDMKLKQIWVLVKLTVHGLDGSTVSKTSFGSSEVKFYKDNPDKPLDIADDLKAAVTDGMKKAASMFGLAADVYGKREVLERTGAGRDQLSTLYKVGEKAGMTRDQVDSYCQSASGKLPRELEAIAVLGFINELRSKEVRSA